MSRTLINIEDVIEWCNHLKNTGHCEVNINSIPFLLNVHYDTEEELNKQPGSLKSEELKKYRTDSVTRHLSA